jgi:hypothetical protein
MNAIEKNLTNWGASQMHSIPVAGLLSRNSTAYSHKAPFRCWVLREAVSWRLHDLLTQSYALHQKDHVLGARILLRSGFETLAALIYLNHNIQQVLDSKLDFQAFSELTTRLVAGSKNASTEHEAVSVLTILEKGDKRYPGMRGLYDSLSESAHPNFAGMVWGYSKVDHSVLETNFSNRWVDLHGGSHLSSIETCMMVFCNEYGEVWTDLLGKLESWIVENSARLDSTKGDPPPRQQA